MGLQSSVLDIIEADYPHDQRKRLSKTLDAWIKQDQDKATWGVLELAITNANRVELALSPLSDLNTSKNTISIRNFIQPAVTLSRLGLANPFHNMIGC